MVRRGGGTADMAYPLCPPPRRPLPHPAVVVKGSHVRSRVPRPPIRRPLITVRRLSQRSVTSSAVPPGRLNRRHYSEGCRRSLWQHVLPGAVRHSGCWPHRKSRLFNSAASSAHFAAQFLQRSTHLHSRSQVSPSGNPPRTVRMQAPPSAQLLAPGCGYACRVLRCPRHCN